LSTSAGARKTGEDLKKLQQRLQKPTVFSVGDLVVWKEGLKNRRVPEVGVPGVVTRIFEPPMCAPTESMSSGNPEFGEPLSLVIGLQVENGDKEGAFTEMFCDGRRFEHFVS
jgi:hypothetical protein